MAGNADINVTRRIIRAATKIEAHELTATLLSFAFVFILMAAYFILRPVRDAMASDWSDVEVSWLWSMTFFFSLVAVSVYGAVVSAVRFQTLVPAVYAFFAASFFAFYFGSSFVADAVLVDKAFYVWLSVFSLFHVSVFWSFMSDLWSREQAPRLFGFIATGASVGAIVGPLITALLVERIGTDNLMLVSATLLLLPIPIILTLARLKITTLGNADVSADLSAQQAIGRNPFAGFGIFLTSRYLIGIGLFIILYVAIGSFVYFELKNLLAEFSREDRTQIWAYIDLAVNSLAIFTAMFLTSRIATRFGMATTLALVPLLIVVGMLVIALSPVVAVVAGLQVARRAGNYAITRPGREMLFTVVDRETRFKAKPVIDIVLYRGGDMLTAWAFTLLTAGFGLGLGAVAAVGAVIAAIWAVVGIYLGRTYERFGDIGVDPD
ncbi:MAG: MFS transporter [Gammaproteobacteria bacterium]|nr:MFS transporter [Gammaproteobacteria bacterium]NNC57181.1 MFS transporter [Woeseiaceae bacterium]NNL50864.1 MFS transporter [Woeseiaceae bacterium]